jgi:hypothetical protein
LFPCPVECQSKQLLEEFRAFLVRNEQDWREFREWREETGERIATLEVKSNDLSGNGKAGRMANVEERTTALEKAWWKLVGACFAVAGIVDLALHFLPWGK